MVDQDFIKWTKTLPDWQCDALRRIARHGDLDATERQEVLTRLLDRCGIPQNGDVSCIPLEEADIFATVRPGPKTILHSLGQTQHVNRLASGQTLTFSESGITLIYGDNGSGKSGYCRILKKVCGARVVEDILGNVFDSAGKAPGEARIEYRVGDDPTTQTFLWRDGMASPDSLASLSVFDSKSARLYVDEKNRITFLPVEIDLLEKLASLFMHLAAEVNKEIQIVDARLAQKLIGFHAGTPVSVLVCKLELATPAGDLPEEDQIEALGLWNAALEEELANLHKALSKDPMALAQQYRRLGGILKSLCADIHTIQNELGDDVYSTLRTTHERARTASEAASLAARESFGTVPISVADLTAWRLMYDYAREYSSRIYPDTPPPARRCGDRCVLCQQELSDEARQRLTLFEEYVAGRAAQEARSASEDLRLALGKLKSLEIRPQSDVDLMLQEFRHVSEEYATLADSISAFFYHAGRRKMAMIATAEDKGDIDSVIPLPALSADSIVHAINKLTDASQGLEQAHASGTGRADALAKLNALQDQKYLSTALPSVLARLADLRLRNKLTACQNALATKKISHQVSALRSKLVTAELEGNISTEIRNLRIEHIPFVLKEESQKGVSHVEVAMDTTIPASKRDILSEGEQRALALSCFLGEIATDSQKHGLIIDDPVSSLDIDRMRLVARRLVEEAAKGRQIIIFTHNAPFYYELRNHAASSNPPIDVLTHTVRRTMPQGTGVVSQNDVPWLAKKVKERVSYLENVIAEMGSPESTDEDTYRRKVTEFYSQLRETWERLVEELLLAGVVQRFDPAVKTQTLSRVVVDDNDFKTVFFCMRKASERTGHDISIGLGASPPLAGEMKEDLEKLKTYLTEIRKRAVETEKRRKKLV